MSPPADEGRIQRTTNVLFEALRPRTPAQPLGTPPEVVVREKTVVWMTPAPELPPANPGSRPSDRGAPLESEADRAIAARQRETRKRWAAERRHETTVHHEHHHHLHEDEPVEQGRTTDPDDREIVDAQVVDDVWHAPADVGSLPPGANRALGQRPNDPFQSTFQKPRRRNRND